MSDKIWCTDVCAYDDSTFEKTETCYFRFEASESESRSGVRPESLKCSTNVVKSTDGRVLKRELDCENTDNMEGAPHFCTSYDRKYPCEHEKSFSCSKQEPGGGGHGGHDRCDITAGEAWCGVLERCSDYCPCDRK